MESLGKVLPFQKPRVAPWGAARGLASVLEGERAEKTLWCNVALDEVQPAREARYADLPDDLAPGPRAALRERKIEQLFSHQAAAYALAKSGRDVVVATPTASGKSLCFNLPVLDQLSREAEGRALYLFPTKALSRDQEDALRKLMTDAAIPHGAIAYDGDTPGDARRAARERSGVLLTNPDMLHTGILPHHASWARLFANLRYVVVDELHSYRGVFALPPGERAPPPGPGGEIPRQRPPLSLRLRHHRQPQRARLADARPRGLPGRRERRPGGPPKAARLQPPGGERRARHPGELREDRHPADRRSGARRSADAALRAVAQQRRGDAQVPA